MTCKWHFNKLPRASQFQNPTQSQFFNWDSITGTPGRALVREGIQNALDAQNSNKDMVRVKITVAYDHTPQNKDVLSSPELRKHIESKGKGMPKHLPEKNDKHTFLVFEDFGTYGLTGKVAEYPPREGEDNHFFDFFRAVGSTAKESGKRGKWGVGKHAFWMASRIHTVLGFTIREGDKDMLLMGKTILPIHALKDGGVKEYFDGYYGIPEGPGDSLGLILPISDAGIVDRMAQDFKLQRAQNKEPGLSLVVPWLNEDIEYEHIIQSVLDDYFYLILTGNLEVTLEHKSVSVNLNAETIQNIPAIDEIVNLLGNEYCNQAQEYVSLGMRYMDVSQKKEFTIIRPDNPDKPTWENVKNSIGEEQLNELSRNYREGKDVFFRTELSVTPSEGDSEPSHFDIALVKTDNGEQYYPFFIREGLIIPDVKGGGKRDALSFVIAEQQVLADFLGKSENPAHTDWQKDLLKDSYLYSDSILKFVRRSVTSIVSMLVAADNERDEEFLSDIFPLEAPEDASPPNNNKKKKKHPSVSKPKFCKIDHVSGGFKVCNGEVEVPQDSTLTVQVAYGSWGGGALNKYRKLDFQLDSSGFAVDYDGLDITKIEDNKIDAKVTKKEFSLSVYNFDQNRDLYVSADITPALEN